MVAVCRFPKKTDLSVKRAPILHPFGNTLTMEGAGFTVNTILPPDRLELKTVEAGGDSHMLFEKTTDYTAEQKMSAAP